MGSTTKMKAVVFNGEGGPEVIGISEVEISTPKDHELLVKVKAAGVNKPDALQRQGLYKPPLGASDIPGLEFSGVIVSKGKACTKYNVGEFVCGLVAGGAYAQYCVIDEDNVIPIPNGASLERAAAIPETFCTVWTNLFQNTGIKPGDSLLIHGGSSGIGTTAIQLAKLFGVGPIFVTCGNNEKCEKCVEIGATYAINYNEDDFVKYVLDKTENKGVNWIIDIVGGSYVARNYNCASTKGHIIQLASLGGASKDVNVGLIVAKSLTHKGSTLRGRSVEEKKEIIDDLVANVWPQFAKLQVPLVTATYPYTSAKLAHELLDSSKHIGKIILTFDDD